MPEPLPYTLSSAHIFVTNLADARTFYVEVMGMPLAFEGDGFLGLDTGVCGLMVFESGERLEGEVETCLHLAVADIHEAHARLSAKGVRFKGDPWQESWGGWLATFIDSAGNILHLVQLPE